MSDSLHDIMNSRMPQEPPEIVVIKRFIEKEFQAGCQVTAKPDQIIIQVSSAALAGALRVRLHELKKLCQTEKRLFIRIA